jgi:hypothetical protein
MDRSGGELMRRLPAIAMCMLLCSAGRAFAQGSPLDRVRIVIGAAGNEPLSTFAESFARTRNLESAPITADLTVSRSPVFDAGARIRFWRANSVGVVAFYGSGSAIGTVDAMLPHPFYFNQPREVKGPVSVDRRVAGLHSELVHTFDISRSVDLSAFGGPTFFWMKQDLVSDVAFTDSYPYDTAEFKSAVVRSGKKSGVGANVGGDMTWHFSRVAGLAVQGRYVYSSVDVQIPDSSMVTVHASRIEVGAGLRLFLGGR